MTENSGSCIKKYRTAVFLAIAVFLGGCAVSPVLKKEVQIAPVAEKIPMKAALLIPESSRNLNTAQKLPTGCIGGDLTPSPYGVIFEETARDTFVQFFDNVSIIRAMPPPQGHDVVIETTFDSIGYKTACLASPAEHYIAKGTIRMMDKTGKEIWRSGYTSHQSDFSMQWTMSMTGFTEELGRRISSTISSLISEWSREIVHPVRQYAKQIAASKYAQPVPEIKKEYRPDSKLPPLRKDAYAVIIGIDYKDRQDIPNLQYASQDAIKVYDILTDQRYGGIPKENALLLLNEKATRNEMVAAFRKIKTWDGYVYVYYSGHGAPKTKGEKFVDAFLVPHDAIITDPEAMEDTAIKMSYLQELVDTSNAKGVMVALDACFSGGGKSIVPKGGKPLVGMMTAPEIIKPKGTGKVIITSSATNQQSWEDETEIKGGIFTHYLIDGLKGNASRDVWVNVNDIAGYIADNVPKTARRLKGIDQTPQITGRADFAVTRNWERARVMDIEIARNRLKDIFEKGLITAEQLSRALDELKTQKRSKTLNAFLEGKIDEKRFGELY
jgi:hypothetical protein